MLGVGVYLFIEVRARPAAAQVKPGERTVAIDESAAGGEPRPAPERRDAESPSGSEAPPSRSAQARPAGTMTRPKDAETAPEPHESPEGPEQPHKAEAVMAEANKAYDRGDVDEAKAIAQKVLARTPGNVRMLRIVVSSACISGDTAEAQKAYLQLPKSDREQMKTRCARYGVSFTDE